VTAKPSDKFFNEVKKAEGFRKNLYDDSTQKTLTLKEAIKLKKARAAAKKRGDKKLPGTPTIGYGNVPTLSQLESGKGLLGVDLVKGIDEGTADKVLRNEPEILKNSKVIGTAKTKLSQEATDALFSFGFNAGSGLGSKKEPNFKGTKRIVEVLDNEGPEAAASKMKEFRKSGGSINKGLINRREKETKQFLKGFKAEKSFDVDNLSLKSIKDKFNTFTGKLGKAVQGKLNE